MFSFSEVTLDLHIPRTTTFIQIKGKEFFLTARFMFCAADNSAPKMVAAGRSKQLVPTCEKLHNITEDIFIVTTVRTTGLTVTFSFYFSFIWKRESFEVQAYLHLFLTPVMKTVSIFCFQLHILICHMS